MMFELGIEVDHSTVHRSAMKLLPVLEKVFRRHKRSVGKSWRMDVTYIKVQGQWKYLYRALDKDCNTVDFLLRARRDRLAARRYFEKSIAHHGMPETVTVDQSRANLAALKIRQRKYLNNITEQDHRAIKRRTRPILGFKKFGCLRILLNGIELLAHDQQGTDEKPRTRAHSRRAILRVSCITNSHHISLSLPRHSYRDRTLVGAMSLARAVSDESLSREIQNTVAELLKKSASGHKESKT
jgi:putative transposase